MIVIELTDGKEQGKVYFEESTDIYERSSVFFSKVSMKFPYMDVPNSSGHSSFDERESPSDFIYKAYLFGFNAKVIE
ncbi:MULTISPECIES: hypothetical protein [unclassified Vibrio]|uniref:hypothetical protein n=1 Tax=Vibrio TaxID=662 RepID=UPI001267B182|nr:MULTISPECIES: hypothetical protein [unclassified Vibrio]QFT40019.1 hypothetical protein FIU99_26885 [Vibrio sp. THAF64]QGM37964.1 hypothetical protein GGC04_27090 [Vibrio sp. THAF191d]QGN73455.1 hypothetical protein GGC03_27080 [Vibrio sp. THAF191c]